LIGSSLLQPVSVIPPVSPACATNHQRPLSLQSLISIPLCTPYEYLPGKRFSSDFDVNQAVTSRLPTLESSSDNPRLAQTHTSVVTVESGVHHVLPCIHEASKTFWVLKSFLPYCLEALFTLGSFIHFVSNGMSRAFCESCDKSHHPLSSRGINSKPRQATRYPAWFPSTLPTERQNICFDWTTVTPTRFPWLSPCLTSLYNKHQQQIAVCCREET
jgi:hypothetical protein